MIFFCLIISLRIAEDDCEEGGNTDGYRIVEIGQNVHRTDSCQTGCQKHLNSVRNHSLHHTREGVEDAGCLAVVYAKLITYLLCDISHSQDCHRVVGCTDIHQRYERSNGEFGSTLAVNAGGNLVYDIVDSSVSRMISSIPPAIMAIITSSPMPVIPLPIAENQPNRS